jgi:hypothetical protein
MKPSTLLCATALTLAVGGRAFGQPATGTIQFARDIQPILSTYCFTCHGPDEKTRKAGLRLDLPETAVKKLRGGGHAIVARDSKASELVARIFSSDDTERMPPAKHNKQLKESEKQLLKRWIDEGAEFQRHWAFAPVKRAPLPKVKDARWARSAVDHFILGRLEAEGLRPSPEADRYTLARRVALDLTGLPPPLDEVERFVADTSPDAYERFVDRVLRQPSYGERWAGLWLDLARYADSKGFAEDNARVIWRYRDWVIDAFNANMPFDRFTVEQIAGDLLPGATDEQVLATAFHRNTLTNDEGGTTDEEFRVSAVVDRVNTTMQVWMGMTMACAQCHDHKYDAITQEEYFRTFAIFNQTEDSDKRDDAPLQVFISPGELKRKHKLETDIAAVEKDLLQPRPELDKAQEAWEPKGAKEKVPNNIKQILGIEAKKRNETQKQELTKYFRFSVAAELKEQQGKLTALRKELAGVNEVKTPIMRELPADKKRATKIHIRGDFLNEGKQVSAGIPALFPPLPKERGPDRLALAQWLVSRDNPLTARVQVNRFWEQIFGQGLVETPDDYGIRGKLPTHPELLDWLAAEFASDWDIKRLLRLLVTSAAYRQSAQVSAALQERDPENRLLARGPRFRVPAEVIRDQALYVSGLLSPKMHGPPVRPPQPKIGLTAAFGGGTDWQTSEGEDRRRRALYTQWRRTTPYPSMITFDAPSRTVCAVARPRTNTPLQALVTLNDPVYVETAQALARRMVQEGGSTVEGRVLHGVRLSLVRLPSTSEIERLAGLYRQAHAEYTRNVKQAEQMATDPLGPLPAGMDPAEMAAWTVVANVLLNLDETFAKR